MKTVSLKVTKLVNPDGSPGVLDYKVYLQTIMRQPKDQRLGIDISEMERSLRVLNVLAGANGTLTLEDADFGFMVEKVKASHFQFVDQAVMDFVNDVCTPLETAKVNAA